MEFSHTAILAAVQGITEFLPMSLPAHLILAPKMIGSTNHGFMNDFALHM